MEINRLKIILSLIFCLHLNTTVYSQLKGTITDSEKLRPIPGATIFINNTDLSAQTNESGSFSLEGISKGFAEAVIYKKKALRMHLEIKK
jgi:hypothetical protein